MKIKRISAKDIRSGLRQIKQDLGEDAIILANRKKADGIELVAAIDFETDVPAQQAVAAPQTAVTATLPAQAESAKYESSGS